MTPSHLRAYICVHMGRRRRRRRETQRAQFVIGTVHPLEANRLRILLPLMDETSLAYL